MTTKQQIISALEKRLPGARLLDNSYSLCYDAEILAPEGYHFDDGSHSLVTNVFNCSGKSVFWDEVLKDVNDLPDIEPCTNECQ